MLPKMTAPTRCWLWLAVFVLGFVTAGNARELAVGDAVPAFSATDQFGKAFTFAAGPKFLVLGFEMGPARAANAKFAALGEGGLEKLKVIYVMDIHSMPAIGRFFALPKMCKYPFRVVLAESADVLKPFPRQTGKLTVLVLASNGAIRAIRYWNPETETLSKVLE